MRNFDELPSLPQLSSITIPSSPGVPPIYAPLAAAREVWFAWQAKRMFLGRSREMGII